jgi:hypothetical protein
VRVVEQTIQLLAIPAHADLDPRAGRHRDPVEHVERDPVGAAALDGAQIASTDPGAIRQVLLPKPPANPECPQRRCDGHEIHGRSMTAAGAPRLITASTIAQRWIARQSRPNRAPCSTSSTRP